MMINNRSIILFCLLLLFAITTNLVLEQGSDSDATQVFARNDPDLYMVDVDITQFDETGARQHKITAARLTHFPLTDITTLKTPAMTLFPRGEGKLPWDIVAKHGRLLPKVALREEIIELWEQVHAAQVDDGGNFIHIRTDSLTVYPEKDYLETDQIVTISDNTGSTKASGMKAYLQEGRFIFFSSDEQRVQTRLMPVFD